MIYHRHWEHKSASYTTCTCYGCCNGLLRLAMLVCVCVCALKSPSSARLLANCSEG